LKRDAITGGLKIISESGSLLDTSVRNLYTTGNVGIGTTLTPSTLTVEGDVCIGSASNVTTLSTNYGRWYNYMDYISPNQSITQNLNRIQTLNTTITANRTLYNIQNQITNGALGSSTSGSNTNIYGIRNNIYNGLADFESGHIQNAYGTYNYIENRAADINYNTVQNMYGTYNYLRQFVLGGITSNAYGTYNNMVQNNGTFVNSYGVYVSSDNNILNSYGIYTDGEQKNYFSGNVGIGTTNPVTTLHVNGSISGVLTRSTSITPGAVTNVPFSNIPSWVKRITVIFSGISWNGTDQTLVQIGTGGTATTSGYISYWTYYGGGSTGNNNTSTVGFGIWTNNATNLIYATMTIVNITGNTWVSSHSGGLFNTMSLSGGGNVTLLGTLDYLVVKSAGTNTFDAGTINITYEG